MSSTKTSMTAEEFYTLADNIIFNTLLYNNEEFFNKPDTSTELSNIEIMLENLNTKLGEEDMINMVGTFIKNSMPTVQHDKVIQRMEPTVPTQGGMIAGGGKRLDKQQAPSNSLYGKLLALGGIKNYANFTNLSKYVSFFLVVFHVIWSQNMDIVNRHQLMYMTDSYTFETFLNMKPSMNQTESQQVMDFNRQIYNNNTFFQIDANAQQKLVQWVKERSGRVDKFKSKLAVKFGDRKKEIIDIQHVLNEMLDSEYSLPKSEEFKACMDENRTTPVDEIKVITCTDSVFLEDTKIKRYHSIVSSLVQIFFPEGLQNELDEFFAETREGIKQFESKHGIQTSQIMSIKLATNVFLIVNDVADTLVPGLKSDETEQNLAQVEHKWGIRSTLSYFTYIILDSMMTSGNDERVLMNAMKIHFENKANDELINFDVKTRNGYLYNQARKTVLNSEGFKAVYDLVVNFKPEGTRKAVQNTMSSIADDQGVPIRKNLKYMIYSQIFDVFGDILENKDVTAKIKNIIDSVKKNLLVTVASNLATSKPRENL